MLTQTVRHCLARVGLVTLVGLLVVASPGAPARAATAPQRPNGFVPESVYLNSYYLAMHAGPDGNGNWQIDTADEVFDKYFVAGQWNGPYNIPFYGMGPGGDHAKTALSFATWYLGETTGSAGQPLSSLSGWDYAPGAVYRDMLAAAASHQRPIFVHFNGTRYMEPEASPCTPSSLWCAFNQDKNFFTSELQRDQYGQPFSGPASSGGKCETGQCYLTLARGGNLNDDQGTLYRRYKKRNLQQAINYLLSWAEAHPGLLVGVSMDSETAMGAVPTAAGTDFPRIGDYSVPMLLQYRAFQKWKYGSVQAYNNQFQSCQAAISSLDDIMPPSNTGTIDVYNPGGLSPCWAEWQSFRVLVVNQMVDDTSRWAFEAGVPPTRIFSHQSVNDMFSDYMFEASPVATAKTSVGHAGIDLYEKQLFTPQGGGIQWKIDMMNQAQQLDAGWGIPELNAGLGPNAWGGQAVNPANGAYNKCSAADDAAIYERTFNTLVNAYQRGNRVAMPFLWNPADRDPAHPSSPLAQWGIGSCWPAMRAYRAFVAALH